jgi:asparagine N-glycosylation enzyme membrane subunit Stt3
MTPAFRWTLIWLAGSMVMLAGALAMLTASLIDHHYLPASADSFYHARRILDSVLSGNPVIQFDERIHVPEGSWLTWPWGFDTLMARITSLFGPFANRDEANRVLMNIPPVAAPIAVALVVNIARQLKLHLLLGALFVLGFAALPTVHALFSPGNIDHHFAELLWTLGTLSAGIWFFRCGAPSPVPGIVLGCVLGTSLAIHNSLFILQVPIVLTLALLWLQGSGFPDRARIAGFAVALLVTTVLMCIPAESWRRGVFELYTLSWFHFYIASCVAVFSVLLSWFPRSRRNIAILCLTTGAALIPLFAALSFGSEFVTGELASIRDIIEARSPYEMYRSSGEESSTRLLSWMMWLSGPLLLVNLWWAFRLRAGELRFVALVGVLGLALMQFQFRFAVFGAASMLLTPLLLAQFLAERIPERRSVTLLASVLLFGIAFYPTLRNWQTRWLLGGNQAYTWLRPVFPVLNAACDEHPGVVLADIDAGHWIRYHSECSVIGNVFLLTPQHAAKALESARLLRLTPAELLAESTDIRYVFARQSTGLFLDESGRERPDLERLRASLPALERELLARDATLPPQYRLRGEARTPGGQIYARLYEIDRER